MKKRVMCLVALAASFLAACGTVNFNDLVAVFDSYGLSTTNISVCPAPTIQGRPLVEHAQMIQTQTANAYFKLPSSLQNDAVVKATLSQTQTVTYKTATLTAAPEEAAGAAPTGELQVPPAIAPLTNGDFYRFAHLVIEYVFRQPAANSGGTDEFPKLVAQYYQTYFTAGFTTYFGQQLAQPTLALDVNDTEITQAVTVFIELLLDQALTSPIWYDASGKKYYPGANGNAPSILALTNTKPTPLGTTGCDIHMNLAKVQMMSSVAQQFALAASSESVLTFKSVGGVEVGLGVLGKLSIGDNNTLSELAKTVVSEVTGRLTAHAAYYVLKQIDFGGPATQPAAATAAHSLAVAHTPSAASRVPVPAQTQTVRALFMSPNTH
jgi:hypothetical protein